MRVFHVVLELCSGEVKLLVLVQVLRDLCELVVGGPEILRVALELLAPWKCHVREGREYNIEEQAQYEQVPRDVSPGFHLHLDSPSLGQFILIFAEDKNPTLPKLFLSTSFSHAFSSVLYLVASEFFVSSDFLDEP